MHSSESLTASWLAWAAVLSLACALVACASLGEMPRLTDPAIAASALRCEPRDGGLLTARTAELAALRAAVERGPLFAAVAAGRIPACKVSTDGTQWQLDYHFADNATLGVTRDTSIEYTNVAARMPWPTGSDPRELLRRTERAMFAPDGCGIDWQLPAESSATTQVWRGEVCHCQAYVQRDATGNVVVLGLRSAC